MISVRSHRRGDKIRVAGVGFLNSHKARFFSSRFWRRQAFPSISEDRGPAS